MLLCPVLAFLTAIAVEILIGVLKDAGVLALLVLVVAGGAWSLFPVVLTFYRGVWCPYCQRDLKALAETANVIKAYGASLVAIAHQTVPDSNRKFEQENNLGFPILDDTSGIAAAAFGIGWTSECLRELFEQFSTDWTGFNPEVAAIVPMQARYVIGPDDIIAYADINVDYRSEPELSAVLLVLQRLQNATS